jgi:hypothetical protein
MQKSTKRTVIIISVIWFFLVIIGGMVLWILIPVFVLTGFASIMAFIKQEKDSTYDKNKWNG